MSAELVGLVTLVVSLILVPVSVGAHMYVAYVKAPVYAQRGVKRWLTTDEGMLDVSNAMKRALEVKIPLPDGKGEATILDHIGANVLNSCLTWLDSPDASKDLEVLGNKFGKLMWTYMQERVGSSMGTAKIQLTKAAREAIAAENPLVSTILESGEIEKYTKDALLGPLIQKGIEWWVNKQGNGGGAPAPSAPSISGAWT